MGKLALVLTLALAAVVLLLVFDWLDAGTGPDSNPDSGSLVERGATPTPALLPTPLTGPASSPAASSPPMVSPSPTLVPMWGQDLEGVSVHHGEQPAYIKTDCTTCGLQDRVRLVSVGTAVAPTWGQLKAFLTADDTDLSLYVPGEYTCGAFAERLHNNAEAAGIRAAWVALALDGESGGHALNAFDTSDRGLVYIDCTGDNPEQLEDGDADSWDKVAYVKIDHCYGLISLDVAACTAYECYEYYEQARAAYDAGVEEYNRRVEDYNRDVKEFNDWVAGRVFIEGSAEAEEAQRWAEELEVERSLLEQLAQELEAQKDTLGTFWISPGVVTSVDIYW